MDLKQPTFVFSQDINDATVGNFMVDVVAWCQKDGNEGKPLQIILNSGGGGVLSGLAFYGYISELRRNGHKVTIKVLGRAGSAAAIVLQAADHRVIAGNSELLVHAVIPIQLPQGATIAQLQRELDRCLSLTDRTMKILVGRSGGKLTLDEIKKETGDWSLDWWMKSPCALEKGVVDEIESAPEFEATAA